MVRWARAKAIDVEGIGAAGIAELLNMLEGIQRYFGQVDKGAVKVTHYAEGGTIGQS
jgi:hypothetical protein